MKFKILYALETIKDFILLAAEAIGLAVLIAWLVFQGLGISASAATTNEKLEKAVETVDVVMDDIKPEPITPELDILTDDKIDKSEEVEPKAEEEKAIEVEKTEVEAKAEAEAPPENSPTVDLTTLAQYYKNHGFTEAEIQMIARVIYCESNCVESEAERSMIAWTILNRIDSGISWFGDSVSSIITKPGQFCYTPSAPLTDRNYELAKDVTSRWLAEKSGETNVGRTLPVEFLFYHASKEHWHNSFYRLSGGGLNGERIYFDRNHPAENPYMN